jgi:hypothetical protein
MRPEARETALNWPRLASRGRVRVIQVGRSRNQLTPYEVVDDRKPLGQPLLKPDIEAMEYDLPP